MAIAPYGVDAREKFPGFGLVPAPRAKATLAAVKKKGRSFRNGPSRLQAETAN
jgi:hypothetical protein